MRFVLMILSVAGCHAETGLSGFERPSERPTPAVLRGAAHTDVFVAQVSAGPAVDVLWLPEGEPGIDEELELLRPHYPSFIQALEASNADYHVAVAYPGVVTQYLGTLTGVGAHRYIDRDSPDPTSMFVDMMGQATGEGISFSGLHFLGAYICLSAPDGDCIRYRFRRQGVPIHTIVIADSPNRSHMSENEFVEFYSRLTRDPDDRTFSGIVDPTLTTEFIAASRAIGGVMVDVREGNYGEVLAQFADTIIASAEQRAYHLSRPAEEATLEVRVLGGGPNYDPVPAETGWRYDLVRNAVVIPTEALPEGAFEVTATYDVRSDGL